MKKIIFFLMITISLITFTESVEDILGKTDAQTANEVMKKAEKERATYEALVLKVSGKAFIKYLDSASWKQCSLNDKILEGSVLVTSDNSEVTVKLANNTEARILSKTKAEFSNLKMQPGKEAMNETGMKLLWGKIYSNVRNRLLDGAKYEIKTASASAGVRGTQFTVIQNRNGSGGVEVYDGIVNMTDDKGRFNLDVRANQRLTLDRKGNSLGIEKHTEKPPAENSQQGGDTKSRIVEESFSEFEDEAAGLDSNNLRDLDTKRDENDKSEKGKVNVEVQ